MMQSNILCRAWSPGLVTRADDGQSALAIRPSVLPRLVEGATIVPRYESASK
jgi:hypothetical protein